MRCEHRVSAMCLSAFFYVFVLSLQEKMLEFILVREVVISSPKLFPYIISIFVFPRFKIFEASMSAHSYLIKQTEFRFNPLSLSTGMQIGYAIHRITIKIFDDFFSPS